MQNRSELCGVLDGALPDNKLCGVWDGAPSDNKLCGVLDDALHDNKFQSIYICSGNDVKLIRCVLGMMLNSFVVVQGMTVKLRFQACGWGCVRWKAPSRIGCG